MLAAPYHWLWWIQPSQRNLFMVLRLSIHGVWKEQAYVIMHRHPNLLCGGFECICCALLRDFVLRWLKGNHAEEKQNKALLKRGHYFTLLKEHEPLKPLLLFIFRLLWQRTQAAHAHNNNCLCECHRAVFVGACVYVCLSVIISALETHTHNLRVYWLYQPGSRWEYAPLKFNVIVSHKQNNWRVEAS